MANALKNFLQESYLANNESIEDIINYINNNPGEKLNFFTEKYLDSFNEEKLFGKRILSFKQQTELNHAIFAQAMVDDVKGNFHGKTAQLLLRSLSTPINNGTINPYQLSKIFKSQQGLVEVPIHLVLYIGGLYDFYYHSENYKPDEKINLSKINGITGANGKDILENDILGGANPARFIFDSNGLKAITAPFVQPITPKFVDNHMLSYSESYESTNVAKNYREYYFDYTLDKNIPLSNNISSQIPVYGYGNFNNYLNTMYYFFFGKGIDGKTNNDGPSVNDNGIPYHIIGNFNGKLKTIKTYDDANINCLASYNSYGQKLKFDLTNIVSEFNSILNGLELNDEFLYGKSLNQKKIDFFLLLAKLKTNLLGGYSLTSDIGNIIRSLCVTTNLSAKQNGKTIPDFIAILLYSLFHPEGKDPINETLVRPNKKTKILEKYHVDLDGYNGYIDSDGNYLRPEFLIKNIETLEGNSLYDYITWYLNNEWSKEQNQNEADKLRKLDEKGTFVVYPSAGGDIDIAAFFGIPFKNISKTNVVSKIITGGDKITSDFVKNVKVGDLEELKNYENTKIGSNPENLNYHLVFDYINNSELTNLLETNNTLLVSKPNDQITNFIDSDFEFTEQKYKEGLNYFDKYDDIKIVSKDYDDLGFSGFYNLQKNLTRMVWFENPANNETEILGYDYNNKSYTLTINITELNHYGLKGLLGLNKIYNRDHAREVTYNDFKPGINLYTLYDETIDRRYIYDAQSDQRGDFDTLTAKSLIDIFDVDKLEDFRELFNHFANPKSIDYMSDAFGTFNFKSLLKHTNIFGYKHLPNDVSFGGRTYTKDELYLLLTGYSGMFMDFASKTGISKLINATLTLGQRTKSEFVIHEFMSSKITVNNYSIAGPLKVNNTAFNPKGLKYSTALFEPIFAFGNQTRDYNTLSQALGDKLLFRTLLFGSQPIRSYTNGGNQDELIKKYIQFKGLTKGLSLSLSEEFVISELTKTFFRNLNIELNEGNLQLLVTYVRNYIKYTLNKNSVFNKAKYDNIILYGDYYITYENEEDQTFRPGQRTQKAANNNSEGDKDLIIGYNGKPIIVGEIVNGEYKPNQSYVNSLNILIDKFEDLNAINNFNSFIKTTNENLTTKLLETVNSSFRNLSEKLSSPEASLNFDPNAQDTSKRVENTNQNINEAAYRDIKAGVYYRVKTLYDKNVAFNNVDIKEETLIKQFSPQLAKVNVNDILNSPLFFNFNTQQNDICDDDGILVANAKLKDLFSYVSVLDRGNNDYGTKVLVDIVSLKNSINDELINIENIDNVTGRSMWSVLSKLASDHEFLLLPLSSYINLNGAVAEKEGREGAYELAHDMFGVFKDLDMWESNPAFIFQLGSLTSNIKDSGREKNSANLGYDLSNTFCLDLDSNTLNQSDKMAEINDENVPDDIKNSNISAFIVDFGNQNQNMFQNIQISTEEFTNTEESIKAAVALASDSIPTLSSGKLFSAMETRSYSCTVTSLGNATIQPLSYFYLRNVPLFYGSYWITNVSHRITPNTMTTTFKGVRQPITKKPTANATVITYLIKKANERFNEFGGLSRDNETPIATSGKIYIDRGFTTASDGVNNSKLDTRGYGLAYQEGTTETGKYVTYNGVWIVGSYLKLMTGGDETDKLLIKTLISYLLNNAIEISKLDSGAATYQFTGVAPYMIDVIAHDMAYKLGRGDLSLSSLISEYNTSSGDVYETMLTEISTFGEDSQKLYDYLKANDEDFYYPYKSLITSSTDKVVENGKDIPKITFPSEINDKKRFDINTRVNAWVSDQTPSWDRTMHGFSTYGLTNMIFKTGKVSDGSDNINLFITLNAVPQKMEITFFDAAPTKKSVVFINGGMSWDENSYKFDLLNYLNTDNTNKSVWNNYKSNPGTLSLALVVPKSLFTNLSPGKNYKAIVKVTYSGTNPTYINTGNGSKDYFDIKDPKNNMTLPASPVDFRANEPTGSNSVVVLGAKQNGDFDWDSAVNSEYVLVCDDPKNTQKYSVNVMGAWGKTKKYTFLKSASSDDTNKGNTINRSEFAFLNIEALGLYDEEEKKKDWTIRDVTSEQTDNKYVAPATTYGSSFGTVQGKPLDSITYTSGFGMRTIKGRTRMHEGVDLRAVIGTPVYSSYEGNVVAAGYYGGWGNMIMIRHDALNISTLYGHLSTIQVNASGKVLTNKTPVRAGEQIGLSGDTDAPGQPHLHYEVRQGLADDYNSFVGLQPLDPKLWIDQASGSGDKAALVGTDSDFWKLVTICACENYIDQPQGMADVAQSIYNRLNLQGGYGKTISEIIMKEGQYAPTFKTKSLWNAIKDKQTAITAYMATKSVDNETAVLRINTALNAITNKTLMANAATFVGSRTEFLAAPPTSVGVGVVEREPKGKNNAFFWAYSGQTKYYDTGNLAATKIPDKISNHA